MRGYSKGREGIIEEIAGGYYIVYYEDDWHPFKAHEIDHVKLTPAQKITRKLMNAEV